MHPSHRHGTCPMYLFIVLRSVLSYIVGSETFAFPTCTFHCHPHPSTYLVVGISTEYMRCFPRVHVYICILGRRSRMGMGTLRCNATIQSDSL
ncbi:hypothetical protein F4859DRAFT_460662 [Xylaria cf. heliscus]|nr:hypothetical protein F4859DRAFT_460662 [Xylaria cf. heliscus]